MTRTLKVAVAAMAAAGALLSLQIAAAQAAPLRVMTWNIEGARTYRPGWARVLGNQKPDVAGLEEVCHGRNFVVGPTQNVTRRIINDVKRQYGIEYQPVYGLVKRAVFGCSEFGNVLLVKKGIGIAQSGMVRYRNQISEGVTRSYAWANITTPSGLVTVTATHLQNGLENKGAGVAARAKAVRRAQAGELGQGVRRGAGRQIVVGDFNAGINGPELKPLFGQGFTDVDANCRAGKGCTPTQDSGAKIDYVLYRGFKAGGFQVFGSPSSDHRVVVANLS